MENIFPLTLLEDGTKIQDRTFDCFFFFYFNSLFLFFFFFFFCGWVWGRELLVSDENFYAIEGEI